MSTTLNILSTLRGIQKSQDAAQVQSLEEGRRKLAEFIADTSIALDERWKAFAQAPEQFKGCVCGLKAEHPADIVEMVNNLRQGEGEDVFIDMVDNLVDFLDNVENESDDGQPYATPDVLREHILAHNMGYFLGPTARPYWD